MLHLPVRSDELAPEISEPCAAASRAPDTRRADRLDERMVEVIEQQPGAAIAHPELAGGLRERAGRLDLLEQRDLPGSDRASGGDIDPQPHTEGGAALSHARDGSAIRYTLRQLAKGGGFVSRLGLDGHALQR
jgi:hypothetical protein